MKFGFVLPGEDIAESLELAVRAEEAGWDGFFVWEGAYHRDAWSVLAAIAVKTSRIQIGTMLTPLPWLQPWNVASQAATVDQLSGGRLILTVGLGATETGRAAESHPTDRKVRAELLDEGIDVMKQLWSGKFKYEGGHHQLRFERKPPRNLRPTRPGGIPIWVVAAWPRFKSMRRALKCEGIVPVVMNPKYRMSEPSDFKEIVAWLDKREHPEPYDIVIDGETPAEDPAAAAAEVRRWSEVGCTWWHESRWNHPEQTRARIEAGPPSLS
jgi:luciferase-like monooxygenase